METCSALSNIRQRTIDAALHKIQEASQAITPRKTISNAPSGKFPSRSSKYLFHDRMSRRSDTSSLVKRKRAKAEALKASVAFAERQAALLKQEAQMEATAARRKAEMELKKAEITADLKLLESRSVAAVAQRKRQSWKRMEARLELLVKTKEASFLKKKQTHFNGFKTMSKSNP